MGLIDSAIDARHGPAALRVQRRCRGTDAVAEPLNDIEEIQEHVLGAVEAIRDATEQIEAHVAVIEALATRCCPLSRALLLNSAHSCRHSRL